MHLLTRIGLVAGLSATLAVIVALPWLPLGSLWMSFLLVWPVAAVVTVLVFVAHRLATTHVPGFARLRAHQTRCWDLTLMMALLASGGYAANRFLVEGPLGPRTLAAQALVMAFAIATLLLRPSRWLTARAFVRFALPVCGATIGALAVMADATIMPDAYIRWHLACLVLALAGFAVAWLSWAPRRRRALLVSPLIAFGLLAMATAHTPQRAGRALLAHARITSHQALLHLFWGITDRDADGFSALWGGGDCDDHDAAAYPLSPDKDCLGWHTITAEPALARPPSRLAIGAKPQVIVLITIDAFRCGFGIRENEPLRSACPNLVRLGQAGRVRLDAHTPAPVTATAMRALHHGCYQLPGHEDRSEPVLVPTLKRAGYNAAVVATHPAILVNQTIRAQFDHVDEALVARARDGTRTTAFEVSARVLSLAKQALAGSAKPKFIWGHHFDPHAPYLRAEGEQLSRTRVRDYAAEIQRTDAALGWLADQLAGLPRAQEVLLIVTSDHGEEFGEHGRIRHGGGLYEETLQIPIVAWSPGAQPARFVAGALPASLVDMTAFVSHVIAGTPHPHSAQSISTSWLRLDPQIAVNEGRWKMIHHYVTGHQELYDLQADPREQADMAYLRPEQAKELGRRTLGSPFQVCDGSLQSPTLEAQPLPQTSTTSP